MQGRRARGIERGHNVSLREQCRAVIQPALCSKDGERVHQAVATEQVVGGGEREARLEVEAPRASERRLARARLLHHLARLAAFREGRDELPADLGLYRVQHTRGLERVLQVRLELLQRGALGRTSVAHSRCPRPRAAARSARRRGRGARHVERRRWFFKKQKRPLRSLSACRPLQVRLQMTRSWDSCAHLKSPPGLVLSLSDSPREFVSSLVEALGHSMSRTQLDECSDKIRLHSHGSLTQTRQLCMTSIPLLSSHVFGSIEQH